MRVYSDIDGVYNAFITVMEPQVPQPELTGWRGSWKNGQVHTRFFESPPEEWGEYFPLCWSEELIESVNNLASRGDIEFVWATTWRRLAPLHFAPTSGLKGEHWRVLDAPWERIEKTDHWWKLELVKADYEANPVDKFVWIDDQLAEHPEAVAWAESLPGGKVVIPTAHTALTRAEWRSIEDHFALDDIAA